MCIRLFLLLCLVSVGSFAFGQPLGPSEIPELAKEDFAVRFENPKGVVWKKDVSGYVGATFVNELPERRIPITVVYTANTGYWVQTREEILWGQLPDSTKTYITSEEYLEFEMGKFYLLATRDYGILYEVTLRKNLNRSVLTFDRHGALVKKEEKETQPVLVKDNPPKWKFPKLGTKRTNELH